MPVIVETQSKTEHRTEEKNTIQLSACPQGGSHQSGTSGPWIGKCVKCGAPC